MKDSGKKKFDELWLRGYGCIKIADELGINVNTVKSYCRRHRLTGDRQQEKIHKMDTDINEPRCKCCGIFIAQRNGTKKKSFAQISAEWNGGIVIKKL